LFRMCQRLFCHEKCANLLQSHDGKSQIWACFLPGQVNWLQ
jgi:hypothetical protein